ncbi:PASTA domain-containing protein [Nocardia seriolae]|nr:hypothetical protein [Nocardia seriolae]MTJ75574.1 hypothetical protein [Nocardia seriolae]MTJ90370.1 hypothetical protein [Nocardia seriolae]MTK34333.1 hypothetical protein [Nocardia seriolae]MTK43476.1 hypothetical protein [Nocardia seriolae]
MAGCGTANNTAHPTTTSAKTTSSAAVATTTPAAVPSTSVSPIPPAITAAPTATTTAPAAEAAAIMPSVVCMNLQDAQNKIHEAGVFYSRSKDATGKGRHQVIDRNWLVVAQNLAPGTPFGEGDAILSVVKYGEPNNC